MKQAGKALCVLHVRSTTEESNAMYLCLKSGSYQFSVTSPDIKNSRYAIHLTCREHGVMSLN